jgi:hypothetical protein
MPATPCARGCRRRRIHFASTHRLQKFVGLLRYGAGVKSDRSTAAVTYQGLRALCNTKMSALQVVLWYRNLIAKALLGTRPIILKQMPLFTVPFFVVFLPLFSERSSSSGLRNGATRIWIEQHIVDDLAELSEVEVHQDGRRALLRTAPGPTIAPICRALSITLPPWSRSTTQLRTLIPLWCLTPFLDSRIPGR